MPTKITFILFKPTVFLAVDELGAVFGVVSDANVCRPAEEATETGKMPTRPFREGEALAARCLGTRFATLLQGDVTL